MAIDNEALGKEIDDYEIIAGIGGVSPGKALSLDGFTIHFYRACWYIIKGDLMRKCGDSNHRVFG